MKQNNLLIEGFKYGPSLGHDNNTTDEFNSGLDHRRIEGKNTV